MTTETALQPFLSARYFSGQHLKGTTVQVEHDQGCLVFSPDGEAQRIPVKRIARVEILGNAPVVLQLPCGGRLEFEQAASKATLQQWHLLSETVFEKIIRKPVLWVTCVFAAIALAFASYVYAIPAASNWLAMTLPQSTLNSLFGDALPLLDQYYFKPSQLPETKRVKYRAELAKLMSGQPELSHVKLVFRSFDRGPNAFALPDGTVVLTDEIEALLTDEAVAGVLAHEIGHVAMRHSARQLIQNTATTTLLMAFTGDVSLILTGLIAQMVDQHYSREFEREADQFAIDLFIQQNRELAALEELHKALADLDKANTGGTNYLSSHPGAKERIELIRQHRASN